MLLYFQPLLTFVACMAFCVLFNIRGGGAIICSLGGSVAWTTYLISAHFSQPDTIMPYFVAALVLALYAEIMARVRKCPATAYMLVAFIPLVPGGGIYRTMECALNGDTVGFMSNGIHTLGIAGAIAIGVLMMSSVVRIIAKKK